MLYIFHGLDFMEIVSLVLMKSLEDNKIECVLSRDVENNKDKTWLFNISLFDKINWPDKYIVYQTEPFFMIGHLYKQFLNGALQVWEYDLENINSIKLINNNTIYMPFRYHNFIESWYRNDSIIEKDIDVSFIGYITPYRQMIINELKKRNINVIIGGGFQFNRDRFIKRSKINLVLNRVGDFSTFPQDISRYFILGPKKDFMLCYTNKGCCVENIIQSENFDDLVDKINYYLKNDFERNENVEKVYNEVINMKMSDVIKENINLLVTN